MSAFAIGTQNKNMQHVIHFEKDQRKLSYGGSSVSASISHAAIHPSQATTYCDPDAQRPDPAATPILDNACTSAITNNETTSGGNIHKPTVLSDDPSPDGHETDPGDATTLSKDDWVKCTQCSYFGPASSFPLRLNGTGHVRTCAKHTRPRRQEVPKSSPTTLEKISISWESLLDEIRSQATGKIEIDRFVHLDLSHPGACDEPLLIRANLIMDDVKHAAGYRFNYKRRQDSTQKAEKSSVFTYYCAQLEGEQTKHALHPDESKRRPKKIPKIPRFHCNGWSSITVSERMPLIARVRITHKFAHLAVFSKRASGVGIGANNTLSPQFAPVSLLEDGSAPGPEDTSGNGGVLAPVEQPESSVSVSVKKTRKRKRHEPEVSIGFRTVPASGGNELTVGPEGSRVNGAAAVPTSSSALAPNAAHPIVYRTASELVPGNEGDDFHPVRFPISIESDHITHGDSDPHPNPSNQGSWPATIEPTSHPHRVQISSSHQSRHILPQSQHLRPPLLPPLPNATDMHVQARVLFPSEYISELRRKADIAIAEAERPGGMSIDEARVFEAAFAPLAQLVYELETRQAVPAHSLQH